MQDIALPSAPSQTRGKPQSAAAREGAGMDVQGQLTVVFLAILLHVDLQLPLGGFAV